MKLLIQQGQLIDPSRTYTGIYDILIENETIAKIAPHITPSEDCICMDAAGLCVAPGLIDPHVHRRSWCSTCWSGRKRWVPVSASCPSRR